MPTIPYNLLGLGWQSKELFSSHINCVLQVWSFICAIRYLDKVADGGSQAYKFMVMFDSQENRFYRGFQRLKAHLMLCVLKPNDNKITVHLHWGILDLWQKR